MRQGDVTRLLEMNPIERRKLIDEIAGIAEYDEKKERAMKKLEEVEAKLREVEIILSERYEVLKKLEQERNVALEFQKLEKELKTLEISLSYALMKKGKSEINLLDKQIEELNEQLESLQAEIKRIDDEIERKSAELKEIYASITSLAEQSELAREIEEIRYSIARDEERIKSNRLEIERLDRLIEKLKVIKERRLGYDKGVKAILELKKEGVYGTLASLISAPKKYAKAIEVALASNANNIVVANDRLAANLIKYLRENKLGRASFIPLNKIKPRSLSPEQRKLLSHPGVIGLASELVSYDERFKQAVEFALGSTLVVEDIDVAKEIGIGKVRMVTLDGDLVETSGLMTGGYYESKQVIDTTEDEIKQYEQAKQELMEEINFLEVETLSLIHI